MNINENQMKSKEHVCNMNATYMEIDGTRWTSMREPCKSMKIDVKSKKADLTKNEDVPSIEDLTKNEDVLNTSTRSVLPQIDCST